MGAIPSGVSGEARVNIKFYWILKWQDTGPGAGPDDEWQDQRL